MPSPQAEACPRCCPKCGANFSDAEGTRHYFACGSFCYPGGDGSFHQRDECRAVELELQLSALTLRCEELRKDAESKKDDVIEVLAEMVRDTPCEGRRGESERHERLAHFAQKLKKIIDRKPAALSREQSLDGQGRLIQ